MTEGIPTLDWSSIGQIFRRFQVMTGLSAPSDIRGMPICKHRKIVRIEPSGENWTGQCIGSVYKESVLILIRNDRSLSEFSRDLTHELWHAHETEVTAKTYKPEGIEYLSCNCERMARLYAAVYGTEMQKVITRIHMQQQTRLTR